MQIEMFLSYHYEKFKPLIFIVGYWIAVTYEILIQVLIQVSVTCSIALFCNLNYSFISSWMVREKWQMHIIDQLSLCLSYLWKTKKGLR